MSREYVLPKIYVARQVERYGIEEEITYPRKKYFRLNTKDTIDFMFGVRSGFIRIDKKHKIGDELYIDAYSFYLD